MNKREIGSVYEQKAVEYLEKHGYIIVGQNYFCRYGEIDIIAKKEKAASYSKSSTKLYDREI